MGLMGIGARQPLRQAPLSAHPVSTQTLVSGPWPDAVRDTRGLSRQPYIPGKSMRSRSKQRTRCLDIHAPTTAGAVIDHLRFAPVLIVLPPVYALIAAPTRYGVTGLDRMKQRLPGKNYGTAVGDLAEFWNMIDPHSIPSGFDGPSDLESTHDVFFRCKVADSNMETPVVRRGTHQTLILDGVHRSLMCEIEAAFRREADPALFAGNRFSAPLITSCNLSGDPLGSITDPIRGRDFIEGQDVTLWVRESSSTDEAGSYPILELEKSGLSVQREGGSIRSRELYQRFGKRH